jgi:DNA-binding response OmpR family regulator
MRTEWRALADTRKTRVLYVTGYTKESFVQRGIASLGNALLTKPFTPSLLAYRVREALNCPSSIQPYAESGVQTPSGPERSTDATRVCGGESLSWARLRWLPGKVQAMEKTPAIR